MTAAVLESKSLDDILLDQEFWNAQRDLMIKAVTPIFHAAFVAGAQAGAVETAVAVKADGEAPVSGFNPEAINGAAEKYIRGYTNDWWQKVEHTTREQLRDAILAARTEGKPASWVAKQIEPLFGKERAKSIAVTEMTTLMGAGALAQYKLDGYQQWEWRTAADSRVCAICQGREGDEYGKDPHLRQPKPKGRALTLDEIKEFAAIEVPERSNNDPRLEAMAKIRGYDGLPTIGSVDAVVAAGGTEVRRGVSEARFAEAFKRGDYFAGTGMHGNGTYAAGMSKLDAAEAHGRGATLRIGIPKNAKIMSEEMARKFEYEFPDTFEDKDVRRMFGTDPGKIALQLGYDAIHIERRDFWIILNRSILTVEE